MSCTFSKIRYSASQEELEPALREAVLDYILYERRQRLFVGLSGFSPTAESFPLLEFYFFGVENMKSILSFLLGLV